MNIFKYKIFEQYTNIAKLTMHQFWNSSFLIRCPISSSKHIMATLIIIEANIAFIENTYYKIQILHKCRLCVEIFAMKCKYCTNIVSEMLKYILTILPQYSQNEINENSILRQHLVTIFADWTRYSKRKTYWCSLFVQLR